MTSAPDAFSSATSLPVRPKPPAEFSPLRTVRWGSTSFLRGGRRALTASRPGEPTTSATKRIRKSSALMRPAAYGVHLRPREADGLGKPARPERATTARTERSLHDAQGEHGCEGEGSCCQAS